MKIKDVILAKMAVLLLLFLTSSAFAQEQTTNYSGDLWTRSTLTGDWGGMRNDLAKKGVTFDLGLTQIGQGVIGGGKDTGWEYGGRGDLTINLDTQKLGWWPGGFFIVEVEGNFGSSVNNETGALMPVNTNQVFPFSNVPPSDQLNIPNVSFIQFLSHYFGVFVGKVATLTSDSGDMNEFAHGKGDTQFFNTALNINPTILLTVPYSTLGAGVIVLPTKDPKAAIINISALDGDGVANRSGFDTVFKGNTTYVIEGRVRTDFFGLTGHQLVGATYSAKNFASLSQSLRFSVVNNRAIEPQDNSWCFYYNFDQYLYEPKKGSGQGLGIFGRFGISDGNPNPMHHFYSIGLGGKGLIPGRPKDEFGVGYYYINVSQPKFIGLLDRETLFLRDEWGIEAYYNLAITPWLMFTPDIQVVNPGQKNTASIVRREIIGGVEIPTIVKKEIDTATVLGFRLQIVF